MKSYHQSLAIRSFRRRAALPALLALLVLLGGVALAGSTGTQKEWTDQELRRLLKERPVERVAVDLVLLRLTVEDAQGRPERGLGPGDFRVAEDGAEQPITVFGESPDEPVQLAILLDVSGSMRQGGRFERALQVVRQLHDALRPEDAFALLAFADGQVGELVRWDEDRERLEKVLGVLEAYGRTALTDAIAATPDLMDASARGRKAIVLITDGVDNASELSPWEAMSAARRTGVPIFPVAFVSRDKEMALESRYSPENNVYLLRRYASETGGRLFLVEPREGVERIARAIDRDLRLQYLVGYNSPGTPDGSYRRVKVSTGRKGLVVRHRAGYYSRREEPLF
jgi:Ca-activated chloride channel family protein